MIDLKYPDEERSLISEQPGPGERPDSPVPVPDGEQHLTDDDIIQKAMVINKARRAIKNGPYTVDVDMVEYRMRDLQTADPKIICEYTVATNPIRTPEGYIKSTQKRYEEKSFQKKALLEISSRLNVPAYFIAIDPDYSESELTTIQVRVPKARRFVVWNMREEGFEVLTPQEFANWLRSL